MKKTAWRRVLAIVLAMSMVFQNSIVINAGEEIAPVSTEAAAEIALPEETSAPETQAPAPEETQAPAETPAPETPAPEETPAPAETSAPETPAPETQATEAQVTETSAPETQATEAPAPETKAPETQATEAPAPETKAPETQATEAPAPETKTPETQAPETQAETKAPETQAETKETQPETQEQTEAAYKVTFDQKAAEHGTIRVENEEVAVASYNKEVKENESFVFTVQPAEGFKVEKVKVKEADVPKTANENEYKIEHVTEDTVIAVTYAEVPKETEAEPAAPITEVTITVSEKEYMITGAGDADSKDHSWAILKNEDVISILDQSGVVVTISANKAGEAYLAHSYTADGEEKMESFHVVVSEAEESETESEIETEVESETETEVESETETESETEEVDTKVYVLYITHVLNTGTIGSFQDMEEVSLSADDFVDGSYNVLQKAYQREGMVVTTPELTIAKSDFYDYGSYAEGAATIEYGVADGYVAKRKSETGIMPMAVYNGTIADVEIVPVEGQIPITITFIYEDGTMAGEPATVMAMQNEGQNYVLNYSVAKETLSEGYTLSATSDEAMPGTVTVTDNEGEYIISAQFASDVESGAVTVTLVAQRARYKVQKFYQNLDGTYPETPSVEEEAEGIVGQPAEVNPEPVEGFTAKEVPEMIVSGNGDTVVRVEYERNQYTVKYNSQGGSYIPPKTGLYEEKIDIYTSTKGERKLTCGREEHTHTSKPNGKAKNHQDETIGCYTSKKSRGEWAWTLTCNKEAHTHTGGCYTSTPATTDPTPTRAGYIFDGWYTDAACTQKADPSVELKEDIEVYAKWTRTYVNYTVVYMIENADDNNYSYLSSAVKRALVGDTVIETAETASSAQVGKDFTFQSSTSAQVKADGSTVITVKFSRNVYTITWYGRNLKDNEKWHDSYTVGRKTFDKNNTLSLTAKYGATITNLWNSIFNAPTDYQLAWAFSENNNDKIAAFDTMPSGNQSVNAFNYISEDTQTVRYWLENYNGSRTKTRNGVSYGLYKEIFVKFNYFLKDADFYDIAGYTQGDYEGCTFGSDHGSWDGQEVDFYYYANSYNLDLYGYQGERIDHQSVKLGENFQRYLTNPKAPVSGAKFRGWYLDPEHQEEYKGNYKMPTGLALYADWDLPKFTIHYMSDGSEIHSETVEYNTVPSSYIPEESAGTVFEGWFTDETYSNRYDVDAPLTADVTVYAKWRTYTYMDYTVRYVTRSADGSEAEIAESKHGRGLIGHQVTERAIAAPEGYANYVPDQYEVKFNIDADREKNVITFVYSPLEDLSYVVEYQYKGEIIEEFGPVNAAAANLRVYPDKDIVKKLSEQGYRLKRYYIDAHLVSDNSRNIVIFELEKKPFKITYEGIEGISGWEGLEGTENPNPSEYYYGQESFSLTNPKKPGYEFAGWDCGKNTIATSGDHENMHVTIDPTTKGDLVFIAQWKPLVVSVTVKKVWEDNNDQDGIRPESVKVQLQRGVGDRLANLGETVILNESNEWSYTWKDQPKYTLFLSLYNYNVVETSISNDYSPSYKVTRDNTGNVTVTITNKHTPEVYEKDVTVTKVWEDANNQDGKRPGNVSVQLYKGIGEAKTKVGSPVELNAENGWNTMFEDLPKYEGGQAIEYSVAELDVPDSYTSAVTGDVENGFTVTNTHTPNTLSDVTVTKVWNDENNQDGKRPESVSVQLQQNGTPYGPAVTLNKANRWSYTWKNLPANRKKTNAAEETVAAVYTVAEPTLPDGYTSAVTGDVENGFTVTNTHTPNTLSDVTVTKVWNDENNQDGKRPGSVSVQLQQNSNDYGDAVTLNEANDWSYTWTGLPEYVVDQVGQDAVYTVVEPTVPDGYDSAVTGNVAEGFTVTNTYTPETYKNDIKVTKVWEDAHDQDGKRPDSVKVQLYKSVGNAGPKPVERKTVTLSGPGDEWTAAANWSGLPKYEGGQEITYSVQEVGVPEGYESAVTGNMTEGFKVTNTYTPNTLPDITVTKVWDDVVDAPADNYPAVEVQLQQNGKPYGEPVELNEDNDWSCTWKDLPANVEKKGAADPTISATYEVAEVSAPDGYTSAVTGNAESGFIVTNTKKINKLEATKTLTNSGSGKDGAFKAGETAEFDIVVKNTGNTTQHGVVVTETMSGAKIVNGEGYTLNTDGTATIDEIPAGESVTVKAKYTVTQDDIDKQTNLANTATIKGEGDTPDTEPEPVTIPTEKPDPGLEVSKKVLRTNYVYKAGDTVIYLVHVKNTGNVTLSNIKVEDSLGRSWKEGTALDEEGNALIGSLAPGEEKVYDYVYEVTQDDIDKGIIVNTATATVANPTASEETLTDSDSVTVGADQNPGLTTTKKLTNKGSGGNDAFKAGETAEFDIVVKNTGNTTQQTVTVTEDLARAIIVSYDKDLLPEGVVVTIADNTATITGLTPGTSVTLKAKYKVTQDDIDNQTELENSVTVDGEGETPGPKPVPIPTEEPKPHSTVEKEVINTPKDGQAYGWSETIEYRLTVTNDGNVTLTDEKVTDESLKPIENKTDEEGITYNESEQSWTIASLAPNEKVEICYTYTVKETDLSDSGEQGKVKNTVTTTHGGHDEKEVKVQPLISGSTITKNSDVEGTAALGQVITYTLTITNTGNVPLKDRIVKDTSLNPIQNTTVDPEIQYNEDAQTWTIKELGVEKGVNDTKIITYTYKVTEEDIKRGYIDNEAIIDDDSAEDHVQTDSVNPKLTVTKRIEGTTNTFGLNDNVSYSIYVENTGNVTVNHIIVTDPKTDDEWTIESLAPGATEKFDTKAYTVTADDIDSGEFTNTATASGEAPDGSTVTGKDSVKAATVARDPKLESAKILTNSGSGKDGAFKKGETATFDITVKNTGNVKQKNVVVTETMTGAKIVEGKGYTVNEDGTATIGEIAPEETVTVKAQYTVTQEDIDNQTKLANTVMVSGEGDTPDPDPVPIPTEEKNPGLTSTKTLTNSGSGENGAFKANETATFDIVVENTGNTTQKSVVVKDTMAGAKIVAGTDYTVNDDGTATIGEIPVGESVTVKAEYTVTQDDIDNQTKLANAATVEGEGPTPDPTPVPIPTEDKDPGLTTTKTLTNSGSGKDGAFKANETATFDIVVENTGNTTQHGVVVTDTMAGAKIVAGDGYTVNEDGTATIPTIEVGKSVTVKAEYTVTQDDIDNQTKLANTATVKGEGPAPDPDPEPIPTEEQKPGLQVKKYIRGTTNYVYKAGDIVTYRVHVKNTGNVTLKNIKVEDPLGGSWEDGTETDGEGNVQILSLVPREEKAYNYVYVVTQDDIDKGTIVNTATATVVNPADPEKTLTDSDSVTVGAEQKPGLTTTKTLTNGGSGENGAFKANETAEFDIVVKNTGNTTQHDVVVTDTMAGAKIVEGGENAGYTVNDDGTATIGEIPVGESVTVKAEYTVTQDDIDNQTKLANAATVEGEGPTPDPDPEPIPTEDKNPGLTTTKTLTNEGSGENGAFKANETAKFDIVVKNTGNTTQHDVVVTDTMAGAKIVAGDGYTLNADGTATIEKIPVGESVTVKAEYTVTQDDIDNQTELANAATVEGEGPTPDPDPEPIPTEGKTPGLTTTKTLTNEGSGENGAFKANETATFDIVVKNTGNTTQHDVVVTDTMAGAKIVAGDGYTLNADGTATIEKIPVGESVTVKAEYTVTQDDIDNQTELANTATVEGEGPTPGPEPEPIPTEDKNPGLKTTKTLMNKGTGENGAFKAGEKAEFDIVVRNMGNTTQHDVVVTDTMAGAKIVAGDGYTLNADGTATIEKIPVGESVTVKAEYTVTQDDIDNQTELANTATVEGEGPTPGPDPEPIPTEDKNPGLTTTKTLTNEGTGKNSAFKKGETATFDIVVENTGNTTQKSVVVKDTMTGAKIVAGDGYEVNEDGTATIGEIPVGESVTVKAEYTVTQDDIDDQTELANTATVDGEGPTPDPDPEPIPTEDKDPGLTTTKTLTNSGSGENGVFKANETAKFDIEVKNTGNTTQHGVVVTDTMAGAKIVNGDGYTMNEDGTATIGEIPVGESVTVKAEYTVTQTDIDNQTELANTATVDGEGPTPDPDPEEIPTEEKKPGLMAVKNVTNAGTGENGTFKAGETAEFDIIVTNSGNTTQTDVTVTEQLAGATIVAGDGYTLNNDGTATIGEIPVGESVTVKAEYTVTQEDIDSDAELKNIALVEGDNGEEPNPTPEIPIPEETKNPALTSVKALTNAGTGENGAFRAGETATFTITVTNTGNTTQTNVTVSESELLGAVIAAGEGYTINEAGQAVIDEMAPDDAVVVNATYTVTQADIDSGVQLVNVARVVGSDSTTEPEPVPIPTEEPQTSSITISKGTVDALNGEPIALTGAQFYVALFSDAALTQRIGDVAIIQLDGLASGVATFNGLPSGTYYIAETSADGIPIASGTYNGGDFVPDYPAGQTVTVASGANAAFNFNNSFLTLPEEYYQAKLLTVTKNVTDSEGNPVNSAETFYAGIFADAAYTQLADNVAQNILPLQMNGSSSMSATTELTLNETGDTTFYVTEVDANGTPVQTLESFRYEVTVDNSVLVLNNDSADPVVTITNVAPEEILNSSLIVNKTAVDALNGEQVILPDAQFNVGLFYDAELTQPVGDFAVLDFNGSSAASASFGGLSAGTYYVAEVDANGTPVTSGTYNGGDYVPQYPSGQAVTISEDGGSQTFDFDNSFLTLPEDYYIAKLLTVTKRVVDGNGNAVGSSETFYAGVFADAAYTKLADNVSQKIVPLQMNGGSSATATAELSLNPTGDTMFYITEVDANGTPVQNIGNFAYDATVSNAVLSLNRDSADPNVTITNVPRSMVDANAKSVKTGDETPILPFMMAMILAAGVMLILGLKRRRRDEIE